MAIAPNTTFVSGAILTAAQQNAFGFGIVGRAVSSTDYTLTTSSVIATGMTVTFTAIANRFYKVTYFEPQVQTNNTLNAQTNTQIKLTSAAGTLLSQGYLQTGQANYNTGTLNLVHTGTFTAGSVTVVGCALSSSVSGSPVLGRGAAGAGNSLLLVEDVGPA